MRLVAGAGGGEAGCVSKANAIDTYGSIADIRWRNSKWHQAFIENKKAGSILLKPA